MKFKQKTKVRSIKKESCGHTRHSSEWIIEKRRRRSQRGLAILAEQESVEGGGGSCLLLSSSTGKATRGPNAKKGGFLKKESVTV